MSSRGGLMSSRGGLMSRASRASRRSSAGPLCGQPRSRGARRSSILGAPAVALTEPGPQARGGRPSLSAELELELEGPRGGSRSRRTGLRLRLLFLGERSRVGAEASCLFSSFFGRSHVVSPVSGWWKKYLDWVLLHTRCQPTGKGGPRSSFPRGFLSSSWVSGGGPLGSLGRTRTGPEGRRWSLAFRRLSIGPRGRSRRPPRGADGGRRSLPFETGLLGYPFTGDVAVEESAGAGVALASVLVGSTTCFDWVCDSALGPVGGSFAVFAGCEGASGFDCSIGLLSAFVSAAAVTTFEAMSSAATS